MKQIDRPLHLREGEVLYFDKPLTWTSFDLVNKFRYRACRRMGIKKLRVGHAGTLDPLATGVMILCTGRATKQIDVLQAGTKEYIATIRLGATTPSFDKETEPDLFPVRTYHAPIGSGHTTSIHGNDRTSASRVLGRSRERETCIRFGT